MAGSSGEMIVRTFKLLTTSFSFVLLSLGLSACAPAISNQGGQASGSYQAPPQQAMPAPTAAGATTKVAILLPLSGPQAALGQSLLNAAQLAIYDVGDEGFALLPQDTQGTPAGAVAAAQRALADGATLFIGPVFSPEVEAVKPIAASASVATLALSNNEDMADNNVYVMGLSPLDRVGRVLAYAKKQGLTRIAALIPTTAYGEAIASALNEETELQGLTLVKAARYSAGDNPATLAQQFMADVTAAGGAQAVLFGDSGASLLNLATQMAANGYNPAVMHPLGTGAWEDGSAAASPALAGGWYAAPAGTQRRAFNTRYTQTYGGNAPSIAPLAYDATALAAVLARTPAGFTPQRLIDPMGFNGVDGIFRLHPSGNVERGLAVMEVSAGGVHVADAAPLTFANVPTN